MKKYFLLCFLFNYSAVFATPLAPLLECSNKEKKFKLVITSRDNASLHYQKKICSLSLKSVDKPPRQNLSTLDIYFSSNKCAEDIFLKEGLLSLSIIKANDLIGYLLAFKNEQPVPCLVSSKKLKDFNRIFNN